MKCKFDKGWGGKCENEADDSGFCEEHKDMKCCSCGKQATHSCSETGMFICGFPLCDDCTHNTHPEGHNGGIGFDALEFPEGMKIHCKKSEQKYAPWYVDEETLSLWKKENGIDENIDIILTNKQT